MKKEKPAPIPRTCECGKLMQKCEFFIGMACGVQVRVPNGYNFPKCYNAHAHFCTNCGKVTFFADGVGGEENKDL